MTSEDFHDALYRERCRREALETKVRELEVERDELKADAGMYEGYPGIAHDFETTKRELAASRQQVERLVVLLRRVIGEHIAPDYCYSTGPFTGNAVVDSSCPACEALEALDAIEKERSK